MYIVIQTDARKDPARANFETLEEIIKELDNKAVKLSHEVHLLRGHLLSMHPNHLQLHNS